MMKVLKVLIVPLWIITLIAVACMKRSAEEQPAPAMRYINLKNAEVKANTAVHVDIDSNGTADFSFHTQLVGDPVLQRDRLQFIAGSKIGTLLLNNEHDESPRLNKGDHIGKVHDGFQWFEISSVVLAEKLIFLGGEVSWDGIWKKASHHYLPVQITKYDKALHGWIELSFDMSTEKLILHQAAISTENNKDIKAGY